MTADDGEVAETRWAPLCELRRHAERHPEQYTQWFREEAASLGWFGAAAAADGSGGDGTASEQRYGGGTAVAGDQQQQRQFAVA